MAFLILLVIQGGVNFLTILTDFGLVMKLFDKISMKEL